MLNGRRGTRGFFSAEVLGTVAVCFIVLASIHTLQEQTHLNAFAAQDVSAEGPTVTRAVIDVMTRELRMASYDRGNAIPVSPGPCARGVKQGITEATRTKIRFRQDLNGDGVIGASGGEDVTYDLVSDTIRRSDGVSAPVVLARGIAANGLTFRYFDGGNPPVELAPRGAPAALTACQRDSVAKVRIDVLAHLANPNGDVSTSIASLAQSEVPIRNRSLPNF